MSIYYYKCILIKINNAHVYIYIFFFRFWILLEHPKNKEIQVIDSSLSDSSTQEQGFCNKLSYMPSLLEFMIPLGLVYLFEYLINQGLVRLSKLNGFLQNTNKKKF